MLSDHPDVGTVNRWMKEQENWAIENLGNHGISWVVNIETPMDLPIKEPPDVPIKQEFMRLEPGLDDEDDDVRFDIDAYEIAMFKWKEEHKQYKKDEMEIERDVRSLYGSMRIYLSDACRRIIETEEGQDIWGYENPATLRDAIIKAFLAKNKGASGNFMDAEAQRTHFSNIQQRPGQSVTEFLSYYKEQHQALKVSEMATGVTAVKFEEEWSERRMVQSFLSKLDRNQGGYWLGGFVYRGVQLPATMEEAFQQAVNAEKEYNNSNRRNYERINTYHTKYNQHGGRGTYAQAARGGHDRRPRYQKDAEGRLICLDHQRQRCQYGESCRYSHKPPVKTEEINKSMIDKAVTATTTAPATSVRFANQPGNQNPDVGGGPAPKSK